MVLALAELIANRLLVTDPLAQQRLQALHGKTVALHIRPNLETEKAFSVYLLCENQAVDILNQAPENVDVVLSCTLSALLKIGYQGLDNAELKSGELRIEGDVIIGQRFANLLSELDIDWEDALAGHIGDTPARLASLGFSQVKQGSQAISLALKDEVKKQLHEQQIVVSRQQLDGFLDAVDDLRAEVDRLAIRVQALGKSS